MRNFIVHINSLTHGLHRFTFLIEDTFFDHYSRLILESGNFECLLSLTKEETFLQANFHIQGVAKLICDRTLDPFDFPINTHQTILFKYDETPDRHHDDWIIISSQQKWIDMGQHIYELIALSIPAKKLHPRFISDYDVNTESLVYSSAPKKSTPSDSRWDSLKKLIKDKQIDQ